MKKFPAFFYGFRRLQWKLTVYYTLVTSIVILLLEVVFIGLIIYLGIINISSMYATRINAVAISTAAYFNGTEEVVDYVALDTVIQELRQAPQRFDGFVAVVDKQGEVLKTSGDQAPTVGHKIHPDLPPSVQHQLQQALVKDPSQMVPWRTNTYQDAGTFYFTAPIADEKKTYGAFVIKAGNMRWELEGFGELLSGTLPLLGIGTLVFFIGASIVGLAFGIVTARSFVRRINQIATSVDRWSQGDFSLFVRERSGDELGQLARRLNRMAEQLQTLLRTRQDLATLEERNRLARDLHDSVKQQVFAVSMQISTTKMLVDHNKEAARVHLAEAERLVRQAQQELTGLIRELRPVGLEGKGLVRALPEYVQNWQVQTGIVARLEIEGKQNIPLTLEEALFRILQESLANVARHSHASTVHVHLICEETVTLQITDDGRGFTPHERTRQGIGLSSMHERMQALGGSVTIQSEKGKGTTVIVRSQQQKVKEEPGNEK